MKLNSRNLVLFAMFNGLNLLIGSYMALLGECGGNLELIELLCKGMEYLLFDLEVVKVNIRQWRLVQFYMTINLT